MHANLFSSLFASLFLCFLCLCVQRDPDRCPTVKWWTPKNLSDLQGFLVSLTTLVFVLLLSTFFQFLVGFFCNIFFSLCSWQLFSANSFDKAFVAKRLQLCLMVRNTIFFLFVLYYLTHSGCHNISTTNLPFFWLSAVQTLYLCFSHACKSSFNLSRPV